MLRSLLELFGVGKKAPPATPPPQPDTTDDRDELIFAFPLSDGTDTRHDPMDVRAKLNKALPDWKAKLVDMRKANEPVPPGTPDWLTQKRDQRLDGLVTVLSDAASTAFNLPSFDPITGKGYTRVERMTVLAAFTLFSGEVVEESRPLADGVEPTATSPSADPSPTANATA